MPFVAGRFHQPDLDLDRIGLGSDLPFQLLKTQAKAPGHRQKLPQHLPANETEGKAVVNRHFPLAEGRERLLEPLADEGLGQQAKCLVEPPGQDHAKPAGQCLARQSQHVADRMQAQGFQSLESVGRQPQRRHGKTRESRLPRSPRDQREVAV